MIPGFVHNYLFPAAGLRLYCGLMGRSDPNSATNQAAPAVRSAATAARGPVVPRCSRSPATEPSTGTSPWVTRSDRDWKWLVDPHWLGLFEGRQRLDFANLAPSGQAERVKANDGREVWRIHTNAGAVFAKLYRPARGWARLRRWLRGSDAHSERTIADYARAHGIPTITPVAIAEARDAGRFPASILVTAAVERARPLDEVWEQCTAHGDKVRVIEAAAQLLAHAHQNGFEHSDLHAGNILIQPEESSPTEGTKPAEHPGTSACRALFVDLHNIRIGRVVSDAGVIRNLAQFNQWFAWHASLSERIRFLNRYLCWREQVQSAASHGRKLGCDKPELLRRLNAAVRDHARTLYAKRDRRCLRTGRYFAQLPLADGWRAHVFLQSKHPVAGSQASTMTFSVQQWRQWLSDPLQWVRPADRSGIIKDSHSSFVCRMQLPAGEPSTNAQPRPSLAIVCKHSRARNLLKALANAPRPSRPMLTWRLANALLSRQIPTARPLAVIDRRRFGLLTDSILIAEHIDHAHDLDTVLTVQMRELPTVREGVLKRQIIRELAQVLRRMHERGFSHRDLKAPNVMVQWNADTQELPRVWLVDLDGLRLRGTVPLALEHRALVRLNISLDHCRRVSLTDRARFLRQYLLRPGCPDPAWKTLWRTLADISAASRRSRDRRHARDLKKYGRI